jgi:hypothetical protein
VVSDKRLRTVSLVVKFRSGFDLSNHGPFAVSVQLGVSRFDGIQLLFGFGMKDQGPGTKVADAFVWRSPSADDEGSAWFMVSVPTDNAPPLLAQGSVLHNLKELLTRHLIVNVGDLDALCAVLHMTEGLPQHIEEVNLYANSVLAMRAVPEKWNTAAGNLKGHWPRWQGWDPRNWVRVQPSFIHFRFADLAFHNAWPFDDLNSR